MIYTSYILTLVYKRHWIISNIVDIYGNGVDRGYDGVDKWSNGVDQVQEPIFQVFSLGLTGWSEMFMVTLN